MAAKETTTVEQTGKRFKLQSLLSVTMIIIGLSWFFVVYSVESPTPPDVTIPSWLLGIGFVWYIVNRIRIWWNHS